MKLNLILGKKQIVLASLVLILGAAIYLNYSFSKEKLLYLIVNLGNRLGMACTVTTGQSPGVGYRSLR